MILTKNKIILLRAVSTSGVILIFFLISSAFAKNIKIAQATHFYTPTPTVYVPPDRYRIGNQYYSAGELRNYLLEFDETAPLIKKGQKIFKTGIALIITGSLIEVGGMAIGLGITASTIDPLDKSYMTTVLISILVPTLTGLAFIIPGITLATSRKKYLRKAINIYNSSNPDNPIVIEVGKLYFTPLIAKNCGGISLITAF